jgi:hypothetical protein
VAAGAADRLRGRLVQKLVDALVGHPQDSGSLPDGQLLVPDEVDEGTALAIFKDLEPELGEGWWR